MRLLFSGGLPVTLVQAMIGPSMKPAVGSGPEGEVR